MVLWLADSALDSQVIGWTFYDGAAPPGTPVPPVEPATPAPYPNGLEALRDGWRLLHMAALSREPTMSTGRRRSYATSSSSNGSSPPST